MAHVLRSSLTLVALSVGITLPDLQDPAPVEDSDPQNRTDVDDLQDASRFEPDPRWAEIPPPVVPDMPAKLAVLMLASKLVDNPGMWLEWIEQAQRDQVPVKLVIHAKHGSRGLARHQPKFQPYALPESVPTMWGELVAAERYLLAHALEDEAVTHLTVVSADSVPVKPARWIYKEIEAMPNSRFCAADSKTPPRAEMWWLLRRRDALLFRDHADLINGADRVAADEKVWYFPLRRRQERWGEAEAGVSNGCVMFTDWQTGLNSSHTWGEHLDQCHCPTLLSESQSGASASHPNTYRSLSPQSMAELIDSPFWFARKFLQSAVGADAINIAKKMWRQM